MKKILKISGTAILVIILLGFGFLTFRNYSVPEPIHSIDNFPVESHYWQSKDLAPLLANFQRQKHKSYCGVASSITILNALGFEATQNDFFSSFMNQAKTFYIGMTLQELSRYLSEFPVSTLVLHADQFKGVDEFRTIVRSNLDSEEDFVLINYSRKALNQEGFGHISPIGAYNQETDSFLILDVADFKYPPTWVRTEELFAAMNTIDSTSDKHRGLIQVSKL